jgi:PBSX family phage portal protein
MSKRSKVRAMSRAETAQAATGALVANDNGRAIDAFSFGEPEPVLDRRTILDMLETLHNGRWYEPPVPLDGLARAYRASPHHSSAIQLKRNLLVKYFEPSVLLSSKDFTAAALDFLIFGNCYFVRRRNRLGGTIRLEHVRAKYVRRGLETDVFWWVPNAREAERWEPGEVLQIQQPDINQELYGVPEYLSALQSALLNEAATLFRRRYYLNGSHAGFILYATGEIDTKDTDALKLALKQSKGPGNFRNLFVHAPNGKEGSIKILPIAEVGAKDEFLGIKNVTAQDMLAAHRTPPQVLGIVPAQGSSGFGNPLQAADMFFDLEIEPLQVAFGEVNAWLGREVVTFVKRVPATAV